MKKALILLVFLGFSVNCFATTVTQSTVYPTNGEVTATNLNNNFQDSIIVINGGLDNDNADTTNGFRFYEVLGSLPSVGTQGRAVYLTTDDSLYLDDGSSWTLAGIAGPASSTNNAVVRWDETGGSAIQDSSVLIDDSNNMTGVVGITATGAITGTTFTPSGTPGGSPTVNMLYKDNVVKAWINFDGTDTIAIRDSFNITSITDDGTGTYTITIDTDYGAADYAIATSGQHPSSGACRHYISAQAAGSFQMKTENAANNLTDMEIVMAITLGDQ